MNSQCSGKNIFVNCTAATSGGALTVLKQFAENINNHDKDNIYYIFCTTSELNHYDSNNIKIINNIYKKKWIGRILWDNFGIGNWAEKKNVTPDLIISLQNTGIKLGRKIKQIIYYHQSLPMYEYRWSPRKKEERILWFYKNIYPWFVKKHFYRNDILVVQSDWMKIASSKVLGINLENIRVIKPNLKMDSSVKEFSSNRFLDVKKTLDIIYPAADLLFKNHKVLYEALRLIAKKRPDVICNLKLYVTLDADKTNNEELNGLEKNIEFLGNVEYSKLIKLYTEMDLLVFPSYLETVGFPILEAAYFGLPIIVSDLPYARESVYGYEGASFVPYSEAAYWADAIVRIYENRKRYSKFMMNEADTWTDFFDLIKEQLN